MDKELIIKTNNFKTVENCCLDAQNQSKMIGVIGFPGAGKTTALKYYYKNDQNTYYVKVQPSMRPKVFYSKMLQNMGVPDQDQGIQLHYLIQKIANILKNKNEKNLLIIDEAGKFTPKMLEYLHELRDETSENTGIILAGPVYFRSNLIKWVNSDKDGMPEIYRRINMWEELEKPTLSEVSAICIAYGLKSKSTHSSLHKLCKNFGALHNNIMDIKYQQQQKNDE